MYEGKHPGRTGGQRGGIFVILAKVLNRLAGAEHSRQKSGYLAGRAIVPISAAEARIRTPCAVTATSRPSWDNPSASLGRAIGETAADI